VSGIDDALAAAVAVWDRVTAELVAAARALDAAAWERPSACGDWSNRELLVHLATGYGVRMETLRAVIEAREPAPRHLEDLNTPLVASHAGASVESLIDEMIAVRGEMADLVRALPPDALSREVSHAGRRVVLGELLADLSAHDREHAGELRG
jgi:DinB superfamily